MRTALERWRGTVAYVLLALAVSVALWQNRTDAEERLADQARTLQASCEDRNDRDTEIARGLALIADRRDADPGDVAILIAALAPRDCDAVYPLP